ncbi:unnamed protein product [Pseudo-nitzschia multistriata]|uniref:Uncharacterized protein n=1 Tax=Pseudo-nitzschia multistriata TaxID=183589 RepID=A0A448Z314_9STRA|nr:unnamed protein product [Pseudo-nitzschia multistriata]
MARPPSSAIPHRVFVAIAVSLVLKPRAATNAFTASFPLLKSSATTTRLLVIPNYDGFHEEETGGGNSNDIDSEFYRDLQRAKEKQPGCGSQPPFEENNDGSDTEFYRDLQRAKLDKLGRSIPPDQVKQSAAQAEADFLRAMSETKDEFQKAKDELGSDGAIDLFLEKIREEDKRREEEKEDNDKDEDEDE